LQPAPSIFPELKKIEREKTFRTGLQTPSSLFAGAGLQPAPLIFPELKKIEREKTFRTGLQTPSSTSYLLEADKINLPLFPL